MSSQAPLTWVPAFDESRATRRTTWPVPPEHEPAAARVFAMGADADRGLTDVARDIAHELDESGARLESIALHMARCFERGETGRLDALLRLHRQRVTRMRELVLDLLDATASSAFARSRLGSVDVQAAVQSALWEIGRRPGVLAPRVDVPVEVPRVRGLEDEIVRAIAGVLDDSLRVDAGRGSTALEVVVSACHVAVVVSDDAPRERRFERALGLSFHARATQRIGGSLTVEDRTGPGTRVCIRWARV